MSLLFTGRNLRLVYGALYSQRGILTIFVGRARCWDRVLVALVGAYPAPTLGGDKIRQREPKERLEPKWLEPNLLEPKWLEPTWLRTFRRRLVKRVLQQAFLP